MPDTLVYYPDTRPGITRQRRGRGFSYLAPDGTRIDRATERKRIEALAVPPAYEKVWISPKKNGHLLATGRDARSRKQYRYHPDWTTHRAQQKYDDLATFGHALPGIRRRVAAGLNGEAGEQDFALAALIAMIDRLSIRVGTQAYAEENGTYGATTLTSRHLHLDDHDLRLVYKAKGGRKVTRHVTNRRLQRALNRLHDLPGAELVTWLDDDGTPRGVSSSAVNRWIAEATGLDTATAKTFRTWNGSVAALTAARTADKITIAGMAEAAAERLANTPTIARNSYIHPAVIALASSPETLPDKVPDISGLRLDERRLLALIA